MHKYTITAWTTQDVIEKVVKQIEKKIDVLQAHYFTDSEIYQHEIALYKVSTPEFQENPMASKVIRRYSARIVEVNPVFSIVEKNGMSEEITALMRSCAIGMCVAVCPFGTCGHYYQLFRACERISDPTRGKVSPAKNRIMMSENKVGTYRFVAEPFHCDFSGKLTMSVLGNHLLNCAGFHAADRGFGIATLNENHYTWVLSRLAVELENMPCQYEGFSIQTWVENVYRLLQTVILQFWTRKERLSDTPVLYGR